MPTYNQLTNSPNMPKLGAKILVTFESLKIECTVKDFKLSWGKYRFLIQPTSGRGEQWIEESRISNID